jgi:hypothetical protein
MISPWVVRNYVVFHRIVLLESNFGENLWIGFNPNASGFSKPVEGGTWDLYYDPQLLEEFRAFRDDEVRLDRVYLDHSLRYIKDNPAQTVSLVASKFLYFWLFEPTNRKISNSVYYVTWGVILLFFFVGCIFSFKDRRRITVLFALIAGTVFVGITFFIMARLRIPVEPLFVVCSSFGLVRLCSGLKGTMNLPRHDLST